MTTPNATVAAPTPGVPEQSIIFLARVVGERTVSRPFIDERDRAVLQFRERTAVDDCEHIKSDVADTRGDYR